MPNGIKFCHLPVTASIRHQHQMIWSLFFLIHGRDPLEGCARLFGSADTRYMGDEKGLVLFAELRKLWLTLAKCLQENRLLKTDTLECNKNYKSHHFK